MDIVGPVFMFDIHAAARRLVDEYDLLGLDTEFSSLDMWTDDWYLKTVQIDNGFTTYVFDVADPEQHDAVKYILENALHFTSHNDVDCIAVWRHFGIDITRRNYDTLTMAELIWPERTAQRDLKTLVDKYVGPGLVEAQRALYARFRELLDKPVKYNAKGDEIKLAQKQIAEGFKLIDVYDPVFVEYAAADARYGRKLFYKLEALMYEKDVHKAWPQECEIRAMATRMEFRGMKISAQQLDALLEEWGGRLSSARVQWEEKYGCVAGSPKRADVLISSGVELTKRTAPSTKFPQGQWQLTGKILEELSEEYPDNEPLQLLMEVNRNFNVATFLTGLQSFVDSAGFVHSSISTLGTVTGRWSVTNPAVQTVSGNNPARSVYVSRYGSGGVLVSADLGQIEPRVAVGYAGAVQLIELLIQGYDVYSAAAIVTFGHDYTSKQRKFMKRAILGTLYTAGEKTLLKQAKYLDGWYDVTIQDIRRIRNQWKQISPEITEFSKYLSNLPIVKLESGRYVPQEDGREYKAINSFCQGTARDVIMERAVKVDKRYPDYLVMLMHDELILDVPIRHLEEVVEYVREVMESGVFGIPTPTDIEIFPECWGGAGISLQEYLTTPPF